MSKPKEVKLILPLSDDDENYDENNEDHSRIALYFDTRIESPGHFYCRDEILIAESVAPGEVKQDEERAKYLYDLLIKDGVKPVVDR